MPTTSDIFKEFATLALPSETVIVCAFTGKMPACCAAMPRVPMPEIGMPFDIDFREIRARAIRQNPSIHDGAVMVGRASPKAGYAIMGWSFRLFPSAVVAGGEPNRGSAFNSCFAMSQTQGIDLIYLLSNGAPLIFEKGAVSQL